MQAANGAPPRSIAATMHDPLPLAPPVLQRLAEPLASWLHLYTLPLHIHEVLGAFLFYQFVHLVASPLASRALFPRAYGALPPRTRINWDVHVVSLVQSSLINVAALWVMWHDRERAAMGWEERVWGYTGASGLIQGLAAGYFLWDLWICIFHVEVFGKEMLAHAICALTVFSFGFVSPFHWQSWSSSWPALMTERGIWEQSVQHLLTNLTCSRSDC